MKNLKLYTFITIGVIILSMFLPYEIHDVYAGGSWFAKGALLQEDIPSAGAESIEVYGVLLFLLIIAFISLIKRNFTTALISSILGVVSLLAIPFLFLALVFNLFGPDKHMGVGLLIAFMVIAIYAVILMSNAVTEFKKRKRTPKVLSSDLLDTDF